MVLVEVDGKYIDAEPMKNRSAGSMIKAYLVLWARLMATGVIRPTTHLMDNEASTELKAEIKKNCHPTTRTTGQSLTKFGRESYSNLQESLQMNICRGQRQLPNATVGQVTSTNYTHIESTPTIKCGPNSIGILICPWQF